MSFTNDKSLKLNANLESIWSRQHYVFWSINIFKLFVIKYHCISWTNKFVVQKVVLQKKTPGLWLMGNLIKKKVWSKLDPLFLPSFSLCCILSQLSWARALWTITPVKALGSPRISGSFRRGRRWDLVTWMQIPSPQKMSPEFPDSQNLPVGSACGTPAPVFTLSLIGLKTFSEWSGLPSSRSTGPAPWAVWDGERRMQELHSPVVLAAGAGRCEDVKGAELRRGQLQRTPSARTSLVCSEMHLWEVLSLTVLLGKKKYVTNISGASKLLLLRIIETGE